jgi:alkylation response protein AidB-like acyl-CoA dehydrogenase
VPKYNVNEDGSLGELNTVGCGSIEHKMGIHGSSTCVMNFDDAKGYLVGEENKGLACMFTMMNYERLFVGIQGLGASERSYQNALEYAIDRKQGKGSVKTDDKKTQPIIVHPDVRRMLLNMKSLNEGARAFNTYVAMQLDIAKFRCTCHDSEIDLTPVEFRLLATIMSKPGVVYTREQLMASGYQDGRVVSSRTIDSHMKNLRHKLTVNNYQCPIQAVYGVGYKLAQQ